MATFVDWHQCYPVEMSDSSEENTHYSQLFYYCATLLKNLGQRWRLPHPKFKGSLEDYIKDEWRFQLGWALEVHRLRLKLIRACVSELPQPEKPFTEEAITAYVERCHVRLGNRPLWGWLMVGLISSEEHLEGERLEFWSSQPWDSLKRGFEHVQRLHESSVVIPKGRFIMGGGEKDDSFEDEHPRHHVRLTKAIAAMVYPMTQSLYQSLMGANPSEFRGPQHPVEHVSWFDAVHCANALSRLCGYPSAYQIDGDTVHWDRDSVGWRLPTEAEWEYCAQGGGESLFAGGDDADSVAWYRANSQKTTRPVCQKFPNALGLYDMSGNVCEWCWDWSGVYHSAPQSDPIGPSTGSKRVNRGGGWHNSETSLRTSARGAANPHFRHSYIGFRLVRTLEVP